MVLIKRHGSVRHLRKSTRVLLSVVVIVTFMLILIPPEDYNMTVSVFPSSPPGLLGILLVGRADIYTIKGWLHRHVRIFDRLVIIDGSHSTFVKNEVTRYNNTVLIPEETLNLTNINDQTLRKPAMTALGNPVGSWIMICHADEFWTIDPRLLIHEIEQIDVHRSLNLLRLRVLTASPLESEYKRVVQRLNSQENDFDNFHIMDVSNLAHNKNGTSALATQNYFENRFFRWEEGMKWGSRNAWVVPQFSPRNYTRKVIITAFFVHFKLHDFAPSALERMGSKQGFRFSNSILPTGLRNNSDEGWMGTFLDESFPEQVKRFPPRSIVSALNEVCTDYMDPLWPCELPWTADASFK
jgi:hypothetical protein